MKILILEDPLITPLPSYTAQDARRAIDAAHLSARMVDLAGVATLSRSEADVLVLPYLDGELGGAGLEGIIRFHEQGGGLLFLGDTPHTGRSFPYKNSQAFDLRLTRCSDPLRIRGLTALGKTLLGDLPGLEEMLDVEVAGLRVSAFPPDESHNLLECVAGFKQLSPLVFVERRCRRFLGAKLAVVGFTGGEPRENVLGVCQREWTFHPGLLDRAWRGADAMVARLAQAVSPSELALGVECDPVLPAGQAATVSIVARNLTSEARQIDVALSLGKNPTQAPASVLLPPRSTQVVATSSLTVALGPLDIRAAASGVGAATRTQFGFAQRKDEPQLSMGFSTFRVFQTNRVDDSYRDFLHSVAPLGMQYVRMALAWEDLEPEPGRYVWDIPDQLLGLAAAEKLPAFFWIFPTARGSGLSESGVPTWTLCEPAIDRFGKAGNFPCIWSPFYREHYFGFLKALACRYAGDARLQRLVFDFGNSDFPYTYHYYGDRGDIFDYSPHEQVAFARWLEMRAFPLENLSRRWGRPFTSYAEIPVPFSEQTDAWLLYDEFRTWGVHVGIKQAVEVIKTHAPSKMPPDFPGHGLGSIADVGTYMTHAQGKRWEQVIKHPAPLTEAHNTGHKWGGEAWQVGGAFPDYDDAVFQSVRLEADYLTIPGPDLGVWENDIARIAMIRRSLHGARRAQPHIAIMDKIAWNDFGSLAQVGSRLDEPVDLLCKTCRYDYAEYSLLVLPPDEVVATSRGYTSLLPLDEAFYLDAVDAVSRGLKVLVFPKTGLGDPLNPMRRIFGLENIRYGQREARGVVFPDSWGGGVAEGFASTVQGLAGDEVLLADSNGQPLVLFRRHGAGGFLLAGYDALPDSLDGDFRYDTAQHLRGHTLTRLIEHLGLVSEHLQTQQACCYKECLFSPEQDYLLFYSHQEGDMPMEVTFKSSRVPHRILELSSGTWHEVRPASQPGWFDLRFNLPPRRGYYFVVE
jgi:hypothetical protein